MSYTADGQVKSQTYPAAGNLREETVTTVYNDASMPEWMSGGFGWGTYVATSRFDAYGRLGYMDLGNTYGTVVSYEYEDGTNRLTNLRLDRERIGGTELDLRYAYDAVGNVLSLRDMPSALGRAADKQCFAYDALRRLTQAWTPGTGDCGLTRSVPGLGGAAPYWTSWEYDGLGNRTSETDRRPGQDGGLVTTSDYTYGGSRDLDGDGTTTDAGEFAGPHAVTGVEVASNAASSAGTVSSSYTYDKAGRTVSQSARTDYERTVRSLDWDRESELAGVSTATTVWPEPEPGSGSDDDAGDPGGDPNAPDPDLGPGTTTTAESSNVYTAEGDRLLRTGPDGSVTLYVGGQEITRSAAGVVSATRFYAFAGQTVAMRTATGLGGVTSLVNDPHGTPVASVHNTNWTTTSVDKHYTLPFGGTRGGAALPGDRAFLGKTKDPGTGLTLVGARWYDETVGRFLTVDPIMDMTDPQQWHGYAYAGNNPTSKWDPTGLREFASSDPRDDSQSEIRSAVRHTYGGAKVGGSGPGPSSDPDDADVTDDSSIDLCTVLFLCPGDEEPINYPKWVDDFDVAADRKWIETFDGLNASADLYLACIFDLRECNAYFSMLAGMPQATVEGTTADVQEINGAFAAGDNAEGAGLASVFIIGIVSVKGTGAVKSVPGPNGALRDPVTGQFATNPARPATPAASSTHGNSRSSQATNWLYRRVSEDGSFQKWGITSDLDGRYSSTELDGDRLIPMMSGTRDEMLNLERWVVERDAGPLNHERWAGKAP